MASDIVQQVRSITESITVRTVLSTENTSRDRKSVLVNEPGDKQNSQPLPRNVKLLGAASLLNDMGGNRFHLGIIEGVAESVSSLLKLWAGAWSDLSGATSDAVPADADSRSGSCCFVDIWSA